MGRVVFKLPFLIDSVSFVDPQLKIINGKLKIENELALATLEEMAGGFLAREVVKSLVGARASHSLSGNRLGRGHVDRRLLPMFRAYLCPQVVR